MTTANPDNDPALLEPHGKAWLDAAKRGDVHAMQPLLVAEPRLLGYCGKGCSLGFIGHSALHWAAAKGLAPLAKWLVEECSADVHLRNAAESTPLHSAAQNNKLDVADILLRAGASGQLRDADGNSARDTALERGHSQLVIAIDASKVPIAPIRVHASKAALRESLQQLGADSSCWKVSELKAALRLAAVECPNEKQELVKLVEGLREQEGITGDAPPPAPAAPESAPKPKAAPPPAAVDSDSDDDGSAVSAGAVRAKEQGNAAFGAGQHAEAIKHFTLAIRLDKTNHLLFSNRSACHASRGSFTKALEDANECLRLAPTWAKGYSRKGAALVVRGDYKDALRAFRQGLEIEPGNPGLQKGYDDLRGSLREGELPSAAVADDPPPAPHPAPPASGSAATGAARSAAPTPPTSSTTNKPKATQPKAPGGGGGSSAVPLPQRWIDAAKRSDRAEMEDVLSQSEAQLLVHHKARGIGHTAMHWAAVQGDCCAPNGMGDTHSTMAWLLSIGAEVDARNNSEATPLHAAAANGQAMSVSFLLRHGADASLVNDDGVSAAQLAAKKRPDIEREILAHLEKAQAAKAPAVNVD